MPTNAALDTMSDMYAGVDGCAKGWVALILPTEELVEGRTAFGDLLEYLVAQGVTTVGVDMPIDPPERGERECDHAARALLGSKRSSLFMTPTRAALQCATQAQASEVNRAHGGKGVSAQAFNLGRKILEVAQAPRIADVIEVHPELTFHTLGATRHSKKTWAGVRERIAVLESQGLQPMQWQSMGWGATDDTLDAAAAALSARRYAKGEAVQVPQIGSGPFIWT